MSTRRFLERATAVGLAAALLGAGAVQQALAPPTVQYSTAAAHVQLHALVLPLDGGPPQALLSESEEWFATGPRTLRVARVAKGTADSEQSELKVIPRMGPFAALAMNASGQYALALGDEAGLRFSVHAGDGQELAAAEPIADQVPIALFARDDEYVLVGNRGYFVFGADGTLLQKMAAPRSAYVAAALWAADRRCALLSVLVDPDSQIWKVLQHCADAEGIVLHRSVAGSVEAQPSHLFWPARNLGGRLEIVMTAPSVAAHGRWVLLRCAMEGEGGGKSGGEGGCTSRLLADVPANPILALRGLPLVAIGESAVAVFSPTPDARSVWIGKFDDRGASPRATRRLALPSARADSIALLEGLSVARAGGDVWIAVAYGQPDATDSSGRAGYRSAVAVHRMSAAQLFASRR